MPIVNAPVVNGGRLFVSTHDNHFYALAESDGRTLWDHQGIAESAGILVSTSAAVSGESVIAPYTSGEIFALRVQNGQSGLERRAVALRPCHRAFRTGRHRRPPGDRPRHGLAISHSGVMAAFSAQYRRPPWTRDIGGIQTPWAAGDYVYVLDRDEPRRCA